MEPDPLSRLLGKYAAEPAPPAPGDLESRVWREIRARRARPASVAEHFAVLLTAWTPWTPACAALAVALLIGVVMGRANSIVSRDFPNQTGDSLGLAVFSADAPALPSTLLDHRP